jgi:hypothetical protein
MRLPIMPATFTDRTALAVTGLEWRDAREICRLRGVTVNHIGRRPIVVVSEFLAAISGQPTAEPEWDEAAAIESAAGAKR